MASAGNTSDLTSLYAAAARITHAKLYAEGQQMLMILSSSANASAAKGPLERGGISDQTVRRSEGNWL
jgi:hypothetical protein